MKVTKKIITLLALLFANSAFADDAYIIHGVFSAKTQKNPKIIMISFMNGHYSKFCMIPDSYNSLIHSDASELFVMGTNSNTYMQCADVSCTAAKTIGVDQFVISKNNQGRLISYPENYQIKIDDNYGADCGKDEDVDGCLGYTHCSVLKTAFSATRKKASAEHAHQGKWIKYVNKTLTHSFIGCFDDDSGVTIPDEWVENDNLKGKNVDHYYQCKDKQCRERKKLADDSYFVKPSMMGYTSEPFVSKIKIDANYGENCLATLDK